MWSCKKCETLNEESNHICSLCGALRMTSESAAEQAKTGAQTGANYRYANSADGNTRVRKESEAKTAQTSGMKILAIVLSALLVVAPV